MRTLKQVLNNAKTNGVNYRCKIEDTEVIVHRATNGYNDLESNKRIITVEIVGEGSIADRLGRFEDTTNVEVISPVVEYSTRLPKKGDKVLLSGVFSGGKLYNGVVGTIQRGTRFAFEDVRIVLTDCTLPEDKSVYFRVASTE